MSDNQQQLLRTGCLALGLELSETQYEQLMKYLQAVLRENVLINVTAIRELEAAITFHLLDSLSVVRWWQDQRQRSEPKSLLDLGTGGGFPAVPLAIAWPGTQVMAIDGTGKKIGVVERSLAIAGVRNVRPLHVRGADLMKLDPNTSGHFELITARAVGYSAKLLRETYPVLSKRGWICLMKGPEPREEEVRAAERFCAQKSVTMLPPYETQVPGVEKRTILAFRRTAESR